MHARRLFDQEIDPNVLVRLHKVLVRQTNSIGAAVSLAAAYLLAGDIDAADAQLGALQDDTLAEYQPF